MDPAVHGAIGPAPSFPSGMTSSKSTPRNVRFNMLHARCGSRIGQQLCGPVCDEVVDRRDTRKGYEYAKNRYVQFDDEEPKRLEAGKTNTIDIVEFVPLEHEDEGAAPRPAPPARRERG